MGSPSPAGRGVCFRLSTQSALGVRGSRGCFQVPAQETAFWAILVRGVEVQLTHGPIYVEAVSVAAHPCGHITFAMTKLMADELAMSYPKFDTCGLAAEWRLSPVVNRDGVVQDRPLLTLVRATDALTFLAVVRKDAAAAAAGLSCVNPSWLLPCYQSLCESLASASASVPASTRIDVDLLERARRLTLSETAGAADVAM